MAEERCDFRGASSDIESVAWNTQHVALYPVYSSRFHTEVLRRSS